MSSHRTARQGLALFLAALSLTACGGGMEAKAEPKPASTSFAANTASPADGCGTADRPCILDGIRVSGAAD
jgi:hypothetical protein